MSYDIVKGLKIDTEKNEVWVKCASSNITPKNFDWYQSISLSDILKEDGKKEVIKVILGAYWKGDFQRSNNLFDKSVKYNRSTFPYTWDDLKEKEEEILEKLYDNYISFKNRNMKKEWVIRKNGFFIKKCTKKYTVPTENIKFAKKFKSYEDACLYVNCSDKYNIVESNTVFY